MTRNRDEQAAHAAAERLTGEKYCYGGHYTKGETRVYRGRRYCTACSERLTAQRKANRPKGEA
jgi:hypothetical protein